MMWVYNLKHIVLLLWIKLLLPIKKKKTQKSEDSMKYLCISQSHKQDVAHNFLLSWREGDKENYSKHREKKKRKERRKLKRVLKNGDVLYYEPSKQRIWLTCTH